MRNGLVTLALAALIPACSKPNPLFLDTWEGLSEGATQISGETTSDPPTTSSSTLPTTSTSEPNETTTTTTTTTGETTETTVGSSGPVETTGEMKLCEPDGMGCCTIGIPAIADNFFTDAVDLVKQGCTLAGEELTQAEKMLSCSVWSFGKVPQLQIFNDPNGNGQFATLKHLSVMALRFPVDGGQLIHDGVKIPWLNIKSMALVIPATVLWEKFDEFTFGLYGLPLAQMWSEGDAMNAAVPCEDKNSSLGCRVCGATIGVCDTKWTDETPIQVYKTDLTAKPGDDPGLLYLPLPPEGQDALMDSPGGLVLVPSAAVDSQGIGLNYVPSGVITAQARESGDAPRLVVEVCLLP